MSFNLKLPNLDDETKDNEPSNKIKVHTEDDHDGTKHHTKIDDLDTNPDNIKVSTESDNYDNITSERKPILWGSSLSKFMNCGMIGPKNPIPPFVIKKGKNNIVYVHLYWNNQNFPAEGQIHQLLTSLTEEDVVHLYIHEVPFWKTSLIQSAIQNSKATIHTFVHMIEPDSWESNKFFIWMVGDVLEPIPCDVVALVEPMTIFNTSRGNSEGRSDTFKHDATLTQFWYDFAVRRGLLKLEEIEELRKNKMVLIKDFNSRLSVANSNPKST